MKIVVLGSNGQIGTELSKISKIFSTDEYLFYSHETLDILDETSLCKELGKQKPDVVVNCAAYTDVQGAQGEGYGKALQVNWLAVDTLAKLCKQLNIVLIHISTDYVFEGEKNIPYTEYDPHFPVNWYGHTKHHGDCQIEKSGCNYIILRTSWLYSSHNKNFLLTMKKLLEKNNEVKVVVDQVSTPTWAQDLAKAIVTIINRRQLNKTGTYNYSNEGVASWYDFAEAIQEYSTSLNCKIAKIIPCNSDEFASDVKRPSYTVLDKTLFKQTFDQEIPYWRDSLRECIKELS